MPFINLKTNAKIQDNDKNFIKSKLGDLIKILPGKSEAWLMIDLNDNQTMFFKGSDEKCAIVEVKIYGNAPESSLDKFTGEITSLISTKLGIDSSRIYVAYFPTENWGYAGHNF